MKVLVTGGAGFVGSVLVPKLLAQGFKVRVADFLMFGGESLLGFSGNKDFEFFNGDLRDRRFVSRSLKGVGAVVHLASLVGQEACEAKPGVTREINFEATKILAEVCKREGIRRFVFASTCSNYGIYRAGLATEETPLDITSPYAETKIACEEYLKGAATSSFHPCILRLAMKFGLSPKMRFNLIVNDFAREAVVKGRVTVFGPESWRAFTHVQDAAEAYVRCLKAPLGKISGRIFNIGTENYQKRGLVRLVKKYVPSAKVRVLEGKEDPRDYRVSFAKARKVLGFRPKKSVEQGFLEIKEALERGVFRDPYDGKYDVWYNPKMMKAFGRK